MKTANGSIQLIIVFTLAALICTSQLPLVSAKPQSGGIVSRGLGGLVGAASGAIAGGVAGANAGADAGSNGSANVSANIGTGSGGGGPSVSANLSMGGSNGGGGGGGGGGGNSGGGGGITVGGSASIGSSQASGSIQYEKSTAKPEGLLEKVKDIFKEGKEALIGSKDDKKEEKKLSAEASVSGSGSLGQASGSASLNMSGGNGGGPSGSLSASAQASSQSGGLQSSGSAQASASMGSSTPKPDGFLSKISEIAKKGKEAIKEVIDPKKDESSSSGGISGSISGSIGGSSNGNGGGSGSGNGNGNGNGGGSLSAGAKVSMSLGNGGSSSSNDGDKKESDRKEGDKKDGDKKDGDKKDNPIEAVTKAVSKGTEAVRDGYHKIEDKANDIKDKVVKSIDENIIRPMQSASGSGQMNSEGKMSQTAATSQLKGAEREKYLLEVKRRQESEFPRPANLKEVLAEAKSRGVIPKNEDRSVLKGNHDDEKSVTVEVFDKAHEISKIPVEAALKPIDKMLGYEKDPILRFYDNSAEILRKPLGMMAKPVESVLTGAFKTTEEANRDSEKLLATSSDQERREAKINEEKKRKADRSVVGEIADRTVELATKPIEIVLKPFDHAFGFDKNGRKNPLLQTLDEIYGLSKKPVDSFAKPFESILRKMGDGEQMYQVSIRFNGQDDPKLVTRLADGALNIADRVITKPLELVMKPLNHALGFDEPGKKNPIVEAAHSLKNATKIGVELFTKPIDRIIKEIADIGEQRNAAEREQEFERQRDDASRLVRALDKLHDAAQFPFEIVLRPVSRALGINKDGKKEPLLRAWDVIHQVVRTPIQVISKPVEDAILGEQHRQGGQHRGGQLRASVSGSIGPIKGNITVGTGIGGGGSRSGGKGSDYVGGSSDDKKNVFVDGIKRVEKFAAKPLDVITSPIRRMILGEDNEKVGSDTEKNNREIQAKANSGATSAHTGGKHPDKIMATLEKMNNVILKPLELITQPISDIISPDRQQQQQGGDSKISVKASAQTPSGGQIQARGQIKFDQKQSSSTSRPQSTSTTTTSSPTSTTSHRPQGDQGQSQGSSGSLSASASASIRKD